MEKVECEQPVGICVFTEPQIGEHGYARIGITKDFTSQHVTIGAVFVRRSPKGVEHISSLTSSQSLPRCLFVDRRKALSTYG